MLNLLLILSVIIGAIYCHQTYDKNSIWNQLNQPLPKTIKAETKTCTCTHQH